MTRDEALAFARGVRDALPWSYRQRLKAIHIAPRLHQAMTTVRIFTTTVTAGDDEPYIFAPEDL
jgi:hypothetical protein